MPRICPSLIRRARHIHPFLPLLLRSCGDLPSARNELRWMREHVEFDGSRHYLYRICLERSRGKPLQYILGNQPFGELDILCEQGVLIPRHETEAYTIHIAGLLSKHLASLPSSNPQDPKPHLRILDLCTGTGCIPLLLHALLSPHIPSLSIQGVDISSKAISLAKKNLHWNIKQGHLQPTAKDQITFVTNDILHKKFAIEGNWDILISNPPYISPQAFEKHTSRSVKLFEPKNALVPPLPFDKEALQRTPKIEHGDIFYPTLLSFASRTSAKLLLLEVDGTDQASRVAALAHKSQVWDGCEIWKDDPEGSANSLTVTKEEEGKDEIQISSIGEGNDRAVVCWRGKGQSWLGRSHTDDS